MSRSSGVVAAASILDSFQNGWQKRESMRLGDPLDPALEAASLALSGRHEGPSSRFASIELRGETRQFSHLAPLGYAASVVLGLVTVAVLWVL